jgi:hypothetical protein
MFATDFKDVQSLFHSNDSHDLKDVVSNMISFGNVTRQCIANLNRWLRVHSCRYKRETVILYHGTAANHDITEQGIKRTTAKTKRSLQSTTGYTYLSMYPSMAQRFAEMGYPNTEIALYAVEVLVSDLKADLDQLKNKLMWSPDDQTDIRNTVADSLVFGSGARLKRDIEPYEVRRIPLVTENVT